MKPFLTTLLLIVLFLPVRATGQVPLSDVATCPVRGDPPPVRFDAAGCIAIPIAKIDPQGRDMWVRIRADVPSSLIGPQPLGLYVSAKASSEAYINGVQLGANGVPAPDRARETPGRMDAVFSIPDGVVHTGPNDIVLRLSSFHNIVHLSRPVHVIAIAPFNNPADVILRAYWPSLVTFGVLLAGAFFFASSALSGVSRRDPLLLALLSFLAAAQLFTEVLRGLMPYAYPVQDWRLITVTGLSTAFALSLLTLAALRYPTPQPKRVFAGAAALSLTPLLIVEGFDGKAAFTIMIAALCSAAFSARAAIRGDRAALASCMALAAFAGSVLVFQGLFLDAIFFYEVAAVILVLFAIRVIVFERERRAHESLRLRAHDLDLALARATQAKAPAILRIHSAGAVTLVSTADLILCKGADDYVELHLADGRTILHHIALADLETELPAGFLRVHRSFIVNTACVEKLTREATGVGVLTLSNGTQAPVSRRIMPRVRDALS